MKFHSAKTTFYLLSPPDNRQTQGEPQQTKGHAKTKLYYLLVFAALVPLLSAIREDE